MVPFNISAVSGKTGEIDFCNYYEEMQGTEFYFVLLGRIGRRLLRSTIPKHGRLSVCLSRRRMFLVLTHSPDGSKMP